MKGKQIGSSRGKQTLTHNREHSLLSSHLLVTSSSPRTVHLSDSPTRVSALSYTGFHLDQSNGPNVFRLQLHRRWWIHIKTSLSQSYMEHYCNLQHSISCPTMPSSFARVCAWGSGLDLAVADTRLLCLCIHSTAPG
jgi:hypothetical protein